MHINFYKIFIVLIITFNLFSQENILNNIISLSKNMDSEEQKQLARAKSHERAGLLSEAEII